MAILDDAIKQAQVYIKSLNGIRDAPGAPPESVKPFPFAVAFPGNGEWIPGMPTGANTGLHNIVIEIHTQRKDLPRDYAAVIPFCELVPNVLIKNLYDSKWNNTISTFVRITYQFAEFTWGGIDTLGWRFTVEGVKMQSAVS